jgi:hypothetical protein
MCVILRCTESNRASEQSEAIHFSSIVLEAFQLSSGMFWLTPIVIQAFDHPIMSFAGSAKGANRRRGSDFV